MNTYTLKLSTKNTTTISFLNEIVLDDYTELILNVERLSETYLPMYIKIDWGVGKSEIYDNNISKITPNTLNVINYSPIFTKKYSFEYYPSPIASYRSLSAQLLVKYVNGDVSWIVIPIQVKTMGYADSINDLTLINTNILPIEENNSEHQLKTLEGNYIIELRGD